MTPGIEYILIIMIRHPVDTEEFWKERIDRADRDGVENYSVYLVSPQEWQKIAARHKAVLRKIPRTAKVLDAGCGYGRASTWFKIRNYTGVDFSPDFIERAKQKYPDRRFVQADLKRLPFSDREFDYAFCISMERMVIDNLGQEEWDLMAKEIRRVTKTDLIILEYS